MYVILCDNMPNKEHNYISSEDVKKIAEMLPRKNSQGYYLKNTYITEDPNNITASGEPYTALIAEIDADFTSAKASLILKYKDKTPRQGGLLQLGAIKEILSWELYDIN